MRREPEVPEERVPVGENFDCHARITSKELAPIHSVMSGTLQNACSTRPRVGADLGKSARMHIARLMNSLAKGPKKDGDKSAVAMLKKHESYDRTSKPVVCRDTCHEAPRTCCVATHQIHDNWVVYSRTWSRRSLHRFRGRAQACGKPIQCVKFTKAVARRAYIRGQKPSLGRFAQVNLISVTQMIQNLRIGLRKRQNGKSKVPAKQRGGWPKVL